MAVTKQKLNIKWAVLTFILAYVVLTILGFALYFLVAALMHVSTSGTFNIRTDPAYMLSQQLMVPGNLVTWIGFAWMYFRKTALTSMRHAWILGGFWLVVALPVDFIIYVLLPTPDQLTISDYYAGQFPWIYLVYITVLISPALYLLTRKWAARQ